MNKISYIFLICIFISLQLTGQTTSKVKSFNIGNPVVVSPGSFYENLNPAMKNQMLPKPHPGTDREIVRKVKEQLEIYRSPSKTQSQSKKTMAVDPPLMFRNFNGNNFNGFVPNDNDMAISNHDQVCSVTNTSIWNRDQTNNINFGTFTLHSITNSLGLPQEEFDPKVIYDPQSDRFIMVCLNGFTDSTSNILVGFSQDSTSHNSWNFYALPGDPLLNNLWTDFPMIALSGDELFITVNLLYNDSTWQAGFNESVIWQIDKNAGYSGSGTLPSLLHYNIEYNNEPLRNLCPVKGGSALYGPNMYFLSNRNFAVANDTIFLVSLSGAMGPPAPTVSVTPLISNIDYRMPIDAQQPFTDLLIVNDARILGGFYENDKIQFVFNMLDTISGKTGIYHGIIDVAGGPTLNANLYVNDTTYLAYPNIAYAGISTSDNSAVVSVLLSSPTFMPGVGAFKTDGAGLYSTITVIKNGTGYTNMLNGSERWGDYTGCQTRYNIPGSVWVNGSYSITNHTTRTWIAELLVNSGVSINEIPSKKVEVTIFPNPGENEVELQFVNKSDGMVCVELFDSGGKLIAQLYKGSLAKGPNSFSFNSSALNAGTYLLRITDGTKNVIASSKLIRK